MSHKLFNVVVVILFLPPPLKSQLIQVLRNEQIIEGSVLDSVTSQPIVGARVTCGGSTSTTISSGAFSFSIPLDSDCKWTVNKEGYYFDAQHQASSSFRPIPKKLQLKLTSYSEIQGRLLDRARKPVVNMPVLLMKPLAMGSTRSASGSQRATSDSSGRFRFLNVKQGTYVLLALPLVTTTASENPELGYQPTVYPNGDDISQALPFTVRPGSVLEDMNIELRKSETFTIHGEVVGLEDGAISKPRSYLEIYLVPRHATLRPETIDPLEVTMSMSSKRIQLSGLTRFSLNRLVPGIYRVKLYIDEILSASSSFEIVDRDIDKFQLPVWPDATISGNVRLGPDSGALPESLSFSLLNADNGISFRSAVMGNDGHFKMEKLVPGRYRLALSGSDAKWFINSVSVNGKVSYGSTFKLKPGGIDEFEVVLSSKFGSIQATSDTPGSFISILPISRSLFEGDLIRAGYANPAGRFETGKIVPGFYIGCSWKNANDEVIAMLLDDATFAKVKDHCAEIEVKPGASSNFDLKGIQLSDLK